MIKQDQKNLQSKLKWSLDRSDTIASCKVCYEDNLIYDYTLVASAWFRLANEMEYLGYKENDCYDKGRHK
jgi:hypothetical protein